MTSESLERRPQHGIRRGGVVASLAGMVMLLLAACGGEVPASGDVHMGAADGDAIEVIARDNEFLPESLALRAGEQVTIEVKNEGNSAHNFVIESLDLSTGTIPAGGVATATFTVPEDAVAYRCTLHPGMDGALEVG